MYGSEFVVVVADDDCVWVSGICGRFSGGGCTRSELILQVALNGGFDRLQRPAEPAILDKDKKGLFSCSACHLQFPLLTELRQHYRANHYRGDGERRFECTLCHYEFKQKIHLQRHMEKKHFVPQVRPAGSKARSPLPASQLSQMQLLEGGCRTSVGSATAQGSRGSASRATDGGPGAGGDLVPFRPPGTSELTLDYRTLHSAMIENLQKAIEARSAQNMFELSNMLNVAAAVRAAGASQDKGDEEK